ncbi:hypothetical protein LTR85_004599 [Meristemomyces frigidus]|nr:hypothetical protein LTR85_004599 [Meristemomyces frigidus]
MRTMASPMERVLNTAELLEAILLCLDTKTLLLSQRTCKSFLDTIAGSTKLQRALFFQLDTTDINASHRTNPLLRHHRDLLPLHTSAPELIPMQLAINGVRTTVDINGFNRGRSSAVDASWKRMYLHSAPSRGIRVVCRPHANPGNGWSTEGDGTLTLGDLVLDFVELCRRKGRYLVSELR